MFEGRKLIVATKHQKEKIIAPLFEKQLGVKCLVAEELDTDLFGTFTGEIERLQDPVETAKQKCLKALEMYGGDLAISNEGSFGPHPSMFFAHADSEIILLLDQKNGLEIIEKEISTQTNFNGSEVETILDLMDFANSVNFPLHALILRKSKDSNEDIFKGITTENDLKEIFNNLNQKYGKVYAETDMRAMHNPTRRLVIEKVTQKLLNKIKSLCPNCQTPGYSVTKALPRLECENCGAATSSTLIHVLSCLKCYFSEEKKYPNNKQFEDPMFCQFCNP